MAFYDFARIFCKIVLKTAFNIKVENPENIPSDRGVILCCNHCTYLDPVLIGMPVKRHMKFMAKAELFNRFSSLLLKSLGAFPVSRGDSDGTAINTAINTVKSGNALLIFPEGTRSKSRNLQKFKSGTIVIAAQTGGDIVPCCIKYVGKLRFRSKIIIRYGEVVKHSDLNLNKLTPAVRKHTSEFLRRNIEELLDK